jgi:serine/threonine protein kinase
MTLIVGTRLGPYEILSLIGAGGMGEVYRARDTKLEREVAIKVLPSIMWSDLDRLVRFEREAKVLASLNHPHIAQIYGLYSLAAFGRAARLSSGLCRTTHRNSAS